MRTLQIIINGYGYSEPTTSTDDQSGFMNEVFNEDEIDEAIEFLQGLKEK
jgi:hypothetical protein